MSILHRDLKSANVLIKNGDCKLADFGASISINQDARNAKSLRKMKGKFVKVRARDVYSC